MTVYMVNACPVFNLILGYKYAMMSVKLVLSSILREFKVSAEDAKFEIEIDFVSKSKNGYKVQLHRRKS